MSTRGRASTAALPAGRRLRHRREAPGLYRFSAPFAQTVSALFQARERRVDLPDLDGRGACDFVQCFVVLDLDGLLGEIRRQGSGCAAQVALDALGSFQKLGAPALEPAADL